MFLHEKEMTKWCDVRMWLLEQMCWGKKINQKMFNVSWILIMDDDPSTHTRLLEKTQTVMVCYDSSVIKI